MAVNPRCFLLSLVIAALTLVVIACAVLGATPDLTSAFVSAPTATHALNWSLAKIAKPSYTASPHPILPSTPIDTPTAAPTPINTPSALVMTIVEDAAIPTLIPSAMTNPTEIDSGAKHILISISEQHLYAYENGKLVNSFMASTGMGNSTRIGTFSVLDKIPNAYGATWNIWMPDWLGIYWAGVLENGIHALPILPGGARLWAGYLGTPISFGCVVLGVNDAYWLYNWADIGTPVEIRR